MQTISFQTPQPRTPPRKYPPAHPLGLAAGPRPGGGCPHHSLSRGDGCDGQSPRGTRAQTQQSRNPNFRREHRLGRWGSGSASFCPGLSPSPPPLPLGYEAALWAVGGQALPPFVPDSQPALPPLPLGYEAALWAVGSQALPPFVPDSPPPLTPSPSATRQHFGPLGVRLCLLLSRTLPLPSPPPPRLRGSTL